MASSSGIVLKNGKWSPFYTCWMHVFAWFYFYIPTGRIFH